MATITPVRVASFAMRTRFEIVLWDADRGDADLYAAGEEALREIAEVETLLSAYRPDATLYQLNQRLRDTSGTFDLQPRLAIFLHLAMTISALTNAAFDPTLGDADAVTINPGEDFVVDWREQSVATSRPGVRFDAGAMGKGYALDRARDVLQEVGVHHALLHGGTSSVVALGNEPGGDNWRVAIASPEGQPTPVAVWTLRDGDSLGVSGNYERATHILDPRTKQPVTQSRLVAVLVPGSAAIADAVSTALLVVGENGIGELRESFPEVREWLVVQKESNGGSTKIDG
ncbi:MAG: FAD:protein FMN transferase [Fibrella sp.]|nr:FAD:protein FMN transferase [Armatimonadota bacterium]